MKAVRCNGGLLVCPCCGCADARIFAMSTNYGWCKLCFWSRAAARSPYFIRKYLPFGDLCRTSSQRHWRAVQRRHG